MVLLKAIISFVDFALASVIALMSLKANSKTEITGWYILIITFVLNMILVWK